MSQGTGNAPGHVTAYVRVPLRVVGLVVGPKGATIKRIQQVGFNQLAVLKRYLGYKHLCCHSKSM